MVAIRAAFICKRGTSWQYYKIMSKVNGHGNGNEWQRRIGVDEAGKGEGVGSEGTWQQQKVLKGVDSDVVGSSR